MDEEKPDTILKSVANDRKDVNERRRFEAIAKSIMILLFDAIDLFRFQIGYGVWKFDGSRVPETWNAEECENGKWKQQQHKKTTNF